jgi:MFS family permease
MKRELDIFCKGFNMIARLQETYHKFPGKFWVLVLTVFIDMIGGTLLFPFYALYITSRFNVGMATAGVIIGLNSISGLVGSTIGGALTDKFGRKKIILFGLLFSAFSTLALGFVTKLAVLYPLSILIGFLGSIAGPAHQAMVADMLPEEKRQDGYGIIRVVANISWMIGPIIGGFVAAHSYLMLFVMDAVLSSITGVIVFKAIPETMPERLPEHVHESIFKTLAGYWKVTKDRSYMAYLVVSMLMLIVYQQMYSTMSVYLRDEHQIPTQQYGLLLTISAITVVLTQLWVTQKTKGKPPFLMMALGTVFYMIGFTMFGLVNAYVLFAAAIIIITIGEMIVVPVSQYLAAKFAPEDMRGRYMAFFSLAWSLPSSIGPWAAGMILDHYNPNLVWYAGGVISAVAVLGFVLLNVKLHKQTRFIPQPKEASIPMPIE